MLVFFSVRMLPGDIVDIMLSESLFAVSTREEKDRLRAIMGLDVAAQTDRLQRGSAGPSRHVHHPRPHPRYRSLCRDDADDAHHDAGGLKAGLREDGVGQGLTRADSRRPPHHQERADPGGHPHRIADADPLGGLGDYRDAVQPARNGVAAHPCPVDPGLSDSLGHQPLLCHLHLGQQLADRPALCLPRSKDTVPMTDLAQKSDLVARQHRRGPFADFFYRLVREKPLGLLGAVIITLFVLVSLFADYLAPDPELEQDVTRRLQGSSVEHPLGTDHTGRDFLSRNIYGARQSLLVGFAATAVAVLVATVIGGLSGFIGGRFDLVMQRFVDAWLAFPGLLLLMTIMSILGNGALQVIIVLGLVYGIGNSRVIRGAVISIKENVYFEAAKAVGSPGWRTLLRHVLPNVFAPIIVIFSITIGTVIITEASLSFLGFGLPLNVPSWGGLLSREGRRYMQVAPWLAMWPEIFLTIVVYSLNMFGDAMRDLLDPRLRGGQGSYGVTTKSKRGFLARLLNPFNG